MRRGLSFHGAVYGWLVVLFALSPVVKQRVVLLAMILGIVGIVCWLYLFGAIGRTGHSLWRQKRWSCQSEWLHLGRR